MNKINGQIKKIKNIGFISTRFQGTDGVSLETEKWVNVLEDMRYNCFFYAGQSDWEPSKTMVFPLSFFEHPEIEKIQQQCFGTSVRDPKMAEDIHRIRLEIKESLFKFKEKFKIDLVIIENAVTIPMHIPLGLAITEFIAETGIHAIGHHHDFSWERERFIVNCVNDYIKMAFPPSLPTMDHVTINSEAQHQLSYRRGLSSTVIPNVFDYDQDINLVDDFTKNIRKDLGLADDDIFFLQPTRIIPRKGIEHSIELVGRLNNPKIKIVIAHMSKDEGKEYLERIKSYAEFLGVELIIKPEIIGKERMIKNDGTKIYTLWDLYPPADFVCYPSLYEGFGNAFLESIYFKKPILVNRYAIYKRDIEPMGFDVIPMDSFINDEVVEEVRKILKDPKRANKMAEKNFKIAEKFFSYEVLKNKLEMILFH
jgi:glycosyltransferase involved in cell wall biosynthesis